MRVCAAVIGNQRFVCVWALVMQDEKYFSKIARCQPKIKHRLVPHRQLCTGHLRAFCPAVRLAFDQNRRVSRTKVETVLLLYTEANIQREPGSQYNSLSSEILQRCFFKCGPCVGVADGTNPLVRTAYNCVVHSTADEACCMPIGTSLYLFCPPVQGQVPMPCVFPSYPRKSSRNSLKVL